MMLQQDKPGDFVLATGESRSVREFVTEAFRAAGVELGWSGSGQDESALIEAMTFESEHLKPGQTVVQVDPNYYRPTEVDSLVGDARKAETELGWTAKTKFAELVRILVESDLGTAGSNRG